GGTLFLVKFRGRTYALTCSHVFADFRHGSLFITQEKQAKKGSKPAPIKTFCYPSSPRDDAVGTDLGDICIIEFENDLPPDFFAGSEYVIEDKTVITSKAGHILHVPGVLKEKTRIVPPDITIGYCRLEFRDAGTTSSDPTLRHATAQFWQPEFASVTGI